MMDYLIRKFPMRPNIPLGTVKANISRGAVKLRDMLSDYREGRQECSDAG